MYKLTHTDRPTERTNDPRGNSLDGVFDSIPDVLAHLLSQYNGMARLIIGIRGPNKWDIAITPIMNTYYFVMEEVSFIELADKAKEVLGLKTYDTALPIHWCDDVKALTGTWPSGFVWGYGEGVWGSPVPLTTAAVKLLTQYQNAVTERGV
jgi:hypothetical protein